MASVAELKSIGLGLNNSRKHFELLYNQTRTLREAIHNRDLVLIYDLKGVKQDHLVGDIGVIGGDPTGLWVPVRFIEVQTDEGYIRMPGYKVITPSSGMYGFTHAQLEETAYMDVLSVINTGDIGIPIDLGVMHKRIEISDGGLKENNPKPEERIVFVRPNSNIATKADEIDKMISKIAPEVVGYAEDFVKRYTHPRFR